MDETMNVLVKVAINIGLCLRIIPTELMRFDNDRNVSLTDLQAMMAVPRIGWFYDTRDQQGRHLRNIIPRLCE